MCEHEPVQREFQFPHSRTEQHCLPSDPSFLLLLCSALPLITGGSGTSAVCSPGSGFRGLQLPLGNQRSEGGRRGKSGHCLSSFSGSAFLSFVAPTSMGQAHHDATFDWSPFVSPALRVAADYSYGQFWVASLSSVGFLDFVGNFLH